MPQTDPALLIPDRTSNLADSNRANQSKFPTCTAAQSRRSTGQVNKIPHRHATSDATSAQHDSGAMSAQHDISVKLVMAAQSEPSMSTIAIQWDPATSLWSSSHWMSMQQI